MIETAKVLALAMDVTLEELSRAMVANTRKLFGLPSSISYRESHRVIVVVVVVVVVLSGGLHKNFPTSWSVTLQISVVPRNIVY